MSSRNWNRFKTGDRVVAVSTASCDPTPGVVVTWTSEKCGPGSRQFLTVLHDSGVQDECDVDQYEFEEKRAQGPDVQNMSETSKATLIGLGVVGVATVASHFFGKDSVFAALYAIQRKRTSYIKPGLDHDHASELYWWDSQNACWVFLSYWDNRNARWISSSDAASRFSVKTARAQRDRLSKWNLGDDVSMISAPEPRT
jgi:hypothetical protein